MTALGALSAVSLQVNADTLPAGGRWMTPTETRTMIGDTIPVTYYNGSDFVTVNALYVNSFTDDSSYPQYLIGGSAAIVGGQTFIYYQFTANDIVTDPSYITCDIDFNYSFFDCEFFYSWVLFSHGYGGSAVGDYYQSPSVDGFYNGESFHIENNQTLNGYHDWLKVRIPAYNLQGEYVPIELSSQNAGAGYITRAVFYGGGSSYFGDHYICIACPYVSDNTYGSEGTFTETTVTSTPSGSDIIVNVDVDMSETNGLLGGITSLIQSIHDAIFGEPVEAPEAVETAPDLDYDQALDDAADIMEDIPDITASAGFWFALYQRLFAGVPVIFLLVPLGALLSLLSYALWK